MDKIKVIIAGSRGIDDYNYIKHHLDNLFYYNDLFKNKEVIIISGTAKGVDRLGEYYGDNNSLKIERYPANWNKHGKMAGYFRNSEMAKIADIAIVFWDGQSRGSKHMIDTMKRIKKPVITIINNKVENNY